MPGDFEVFPKGKTSVAGGEKWDRGWKVEGRGKLSWPHSPFPSLIQILQDGRLHLHAVNHQRAVFDLTGDGHFVTGMSLHFGLVVDFVNFSVGNEYQLSALTGASRGALSVSLASRLGRVRCAFRVADEASHIRCHCAECEQRESTNKC